MTRTATLGAMLVCLAGAFPGLGPTPLLAGPPVVTGKPSTTLQLKKLPVPPDVAERLKKAGLDPSSPTLGAQLKALAARTGPAYVRSHAASTKSLRVGAALKPPPRGPGSPRSEIGNLRTPYTAVEGGVSAVYADGGAQLGTNPTLSNTPPAGKWPGLYYYLVMTRAPISISPHDTSSPMTGTATLSFGCEPVNMEFFGGTVTSRPVGIAHGDDAWPADYHGLPKVASSTGLYYYYIELWLGPLPVAHARPGSVSFSFPNLTVPASGIQVAPDQLTVTIDATVDQSPAFAGAGTVDPWGSTGLGPGNATLEKPGVERVGDGTNYAAQMQGDDLLGTGLQLGAGWKVTSTRIKSAYSATAPSELAPDDTWRGAVLKQGPQGSDMRTLVHWHYSGIDSLSYTVEWTLTGPAGQRPLMSMAAAGSCGN
jgi:hypothetical protein